jgi:hypothetical protein
MDEPSAIPGTKLQRHERYLAVRDFRNNELELPFDGRRPIGQVAGTEVMGLMEHAGLKSIWGFTDRREESQNS